MLNSKGNRELAYIVEVDDIVPMNADRLECAIVGGWKCVVGKDEFHKGDKAVYFEIDSKLPEVEPFVSMEFLASKHFKIKSQKIRGVVSQGLLMPLKAFGWYEQVDGTVLDSKAGDHGLKDIYGDSRFVTEELGVTYAVAEDNKRKTNGPDKYKAMAQRKSKLFKHYPFKWFMKYKWGRKFMFTLFGKKNDKKKEWPGHIASKTDVERIQNMIWVLKDKNPYVATEKVDGSSCSVMAERGRFGKIEIYVCSRNVVFKAPTQKCYYDTNIYFEAYEKYNLGEKVVAIMNELGVDNLALQMEVLGPGVQNRSYSLKEREIRLFHIVSSNQKYPMDKVVELCEKYDIPHVAIVDDNYILPDDIDELQKFVESTGSAIDGKPREGIVFYDKETGQQYFKFVSPNYLIKYHQ